MRFEDGAVVSAGLAPVCREGRGLLLKTFVVHPSPHGRCFVDYACHPLISNVYLFCLARSMALVEQNPFYSELDDILDSDGPFLSENSVMLKLGIESSKALRKKLRGPAGTGDEWRTELGT